MVVARRRRRRRPILPAFALVVTVVVLVAGAVSGRDERAPDVALAYLDRVAPLVERSNQVGAELTDLRAAAEGLTRAALGRRIERLAAAARAVAREAAELAPPPALRGRHALVVAALTMRAEALARLRPALDDAFGPASPRAAAHRLIVVGADLSVADRTYEVFVESLDEAGRRRVPQSRWLRDPATWQAGDLAAFVARLRASASLGAVHDVAVLALAVDPPPANVEGELEVLPVARTLALDVVVANVGNERERRVEVLSTLTQATGQVDTARQFADLAPGQRLALRLGGLVATPGVAFTIAVRAGPVPGESGIADNEIVRSFVMR